MVISDNSGADPFTATWRRHDPAGGTGGHAAAPPEQAGEADALARSLPGAGFRSAKTRRAATSSPQPKASASAMKQALGRPGQRSPVRIARDATPRVVIRLCGRLHVSKRRPVGTRYPSGLLLVRRPAPILRAHPLKMPYQIVPFPHLWNQIRNAGDGTSSRFGDLPTPPAAPGRSGRAAADRQIRRRRCPATSPTASAPRRWESLARPLQSTP